MALPNYEKAIKFADTEYGSIGSVYITGGGLVHEEFKGVGVDSQFGWEELTWFKNPTRNRTFAFQNMDQIDVGLIARCEINIKYMDIDKYMKLRQVVGRERYFQMTFFDVDKGDWVTRTMYCSENTKRQLFTLKQSLIGVLDLSLKFVGTNTDVKTYIVMEDGVETEKVGTTNLIVKYDLNGGVYNANSYDYNTPQEKYYASQVQIAPSENLNYPTAGYHFKYWATRDENGNYGACYGANQKTTLWNDLTLYAVWEDTVGNII